MYFTAPEWNGRPYARPIFAQCQRTLAACLAEIRKIPERSVFRTVDNQRVVNGHSRRMRCAK